MLEQAVAPFKGVFVEDKTFSIAVHYRKARAKREARAGTAEAAVSSALDGIANDKIAAAREVLTAIARALASGEPGS